ncbi:hypothetical protein LC040_14110 [Bacillus tianshenii]|nr:hypothetical protein LC040_14110 [Bacillus tianshenii]
MKKFFLFVMMVVVFISAGCTGQNTNNGEGPITEQFGLGDVSFATPKSWTGKYEVVEDGNRLEVLHICKESESKQSLFSLAQIQKEEYQQEVKNSKYKDGLLSQVGPIYYVAFTPMDMVYTNEQNCIDEYNDMAIELDEVKARITVK